MSSSRVFRPLFALIRHFFSLRRNERALRAIAFARPITNFAGRAFVSISADDSRFEDERKFLRKLGAIGVHVRFYAHDSAEATQRKLEAAHLLHSEDGYALAISLVQDRRAVCEPAGRWRDFCDKVLSALHTEVIWVEYLHAVNRVKWGLWNYAELSEMMAVLPGLRRKWRDIAFLAPSAIDFEWDFVAGALPLLPRGPTPLAGISSELYVDRRGAPEKLQGRFDAVAKIRRMRALAMCHGDALEPRLVVTEFNWPLAGTGVWSPVGAPWVSPGVRKNDPSVGEEDAACFSLRYLLLGLASGHAEGMVFWSLAAHGFGLIDTGEDAAAPWRERPAFSALRYFFSVLRHAHYEGRAILGGTDGLYILFFQDEMGRKFAVAWTAGATPAPTPSPAVLGFEINAMRTMSGEEIKAPPQITGAPCYLFSNRDSAL